MEGVEDIPGPVMHEGLHWEWEGFDGYLRALERTDRDMDLCALLPHAALRVYVMGDRAIRHEAATPEDIARMRVITVDAIRAGAFKASPPPRTISHKSLDGTYTPTLRAHEDELLGIAMGMADAGAGFLETVSDWDQPDPETEFAMLRRVIEACGRTAVFSPTQRSGTTHFWRDLLRLAGGGGRRTVDPSRGGAPAHRYPLGLEGSQNPFSGTPTYKTIASLPLADRVAAMRTPEVREKILGEDPIAEATWPLIRRISYSKMFRFGSPPNYHPAESDSIEAMAAREGRTAPEVAYDILLGTRGGASSTPRWSTTRPTTSPPRRRCSRTRRRSWAWATAVRMSASFWMPGIRPGSRPAGEREGPLSDGGGGAAPHHGYGFPLRDYPIADELPKA